MRVEEAKQQIQLIVDEVTVPRLFILQVATSRPNPNQVEKEFYLPF